MKSDRVVVKFLHQNSTTTLSPHYNPLDKFWKNCIFFSSFFAVSSRTDLAIQLSASKSPCGRILGPNARPASLPLQLNFRPDCRSTKNIGFGRGGYRPPEPPPPAPVADFKMHICLFLIHTHDDVNNSYEAVWRPLGRNYQY